MHAEQPPFKWRTFISPPPWQGGVAAGLAARFLWFRGSSAERLPAPLHHPLRSPRQYTGHCLYHTHMSSGPGVLYLPLRSGMPVITALYTQIKPIQIFISPRPWPGSKLALTSQEDTSQRLCFLIRPPLRLLRQKGSSKKKKVQLCRWLFRRWNDPKCKHRWAVNSNDTQCGKPAGSMFISHDTSNFVAEPLASADAPMIF